MSTFDFTYDWSQLNIGAAQAEAPMFLEPTGEFGNATAPRRGSVILMTVDLSATITNGTLTIRIKRKNDSSLLDTITMNVNETSGRIFRPEGSRVIKPGDGIIVTAQTNAAFLPVGTLDVAVRIGVKYDITN